MLPCEGRGHTLCATTTTSSSSAHWVATKGWRVVAECRVDKKSWRSWLWNALLIDCLCRFAGYPNHRSRQKTQRKNGKKRTYTTELRLRSPEGCIRYHSMFRYSEKLIVWILDIVDCASKIDCSDLIARVVVVVVVLTFTRA